MTEFIVPASKIQEKSFNCPHCKAFAQHNWSRCFVNNNNASGAYFPLNNPTRGKSQISSFRGPIWCAECQVCNNISLWIDEQTIFPLKPFNVPDPNTDMPADIKSLYIEAADISERSPRSAAALLRLCLEQLLDYLNISKANSLFERIGKAHLDQAIQDAADSLRIFGNSGIHIGEIKLDENKEILPVLFMFINYITEQLIRLPKLAKEIAEKIPGKKKEEIKKRDEKNNKEEK